jgi:D-serine deaminase-like pyridoxal phosphate-dependent protein
MLQPVKRLVQRVLHPAQHSRPEALVDLDALAALGDEPIGWRFKAIPAGFSGTASEFAAARHPLSELGTPLLTLDARALDHNIAAMASWTADSGVLLAPHGKTTMAPQLWQRQLRAGAWGITLANAPQVRVARAFGVRRVLLANALAEAQALRWIAGELAADPEFEFLCWADSPDTVALMDSALRGCERPVHVLAELGAPGGRTGARSGAEVKAVAEAIRRAPALRLAGLAGYEGALAHDSSPAALSTVERYLESMAELHGALDYETERPVVTAGGSAYFDQVAAVLGGLPGADVVIRAGAYVIHDDGFYRGISPFVRGAGRDPLRSAMHGWGRVVSRPEPGLALLDVGKRDLPFDEGLPVPHGLPGAEVTALNDQHAFLRLPADTPLAIGDVVRLGLSHPCTALDKWQLIPVIDDVDAADPVVTGLIRTFF